MKTINIKEFVNCYLATAAWVTCDKKTECKTFTFDAIEQATKDCCDFIDAVRKSFGMEKANELLTIEGTDLTYLAPHDFFLTRNHHGAGFWDKENIYGDAEALELTEISHKFKEVYCGHWSGLNSKLIFE